MAGRGIISLIILAIHKSCRDDLEYPDLSRVKSSKKETEKDLSLLEETLAYLLKSSPTAVLPPGYQGIIKPKKGLPKVFTQMKKLKVEREGMRAVADFCRRQSL